MQNQDIPKFQIKLDPQYEEEMFRRFTELADEAIRQSVERASIQKQFLTQKAVHGTASYRSCSDERSL